MRDARFVGGGAWHQVQGGIECRLVQERWSRLSEHIFRVDKWSLCRG